MDTAAPTSALPIVVPPFPGETLDSFTARLVAANHLPPRGLDHLVQGQTAPIDDLAGLVGRPTSVLARALPQLRSTGTVVAAADAPSWYAGGPRLACSRCAARRGITATVWRWAPEHVHACVVHRRWVGATVTQPAGQVDLAAVPDVVAAAVHHRNLVRRHGQRPVALAHRRAAHVIDRWTEQDAHPRHRERRLNALGETRTAIALTDPVVQAVNYPETVALASVLASPFWIRKAASDDPHQRGVFFAEIARRLRIDYRADTLFDPIVHWSYRGGAHLHLRELTEAARRPDSGGDHRIDPNQASTAG